MILPIYLYGSDRLRNDNAEADLNDKESILKLISDMKETLQQADGCGLAAPQVGVNLRIAIVDGRELSDTYKDLEDFTRTLINPVITEESDKNCLYSEGCLSVPGVYAEVSRPEWMTVEYYDENFEKKTETFKGFACRMVQHELDHLEGGMFVDHVSPIRRKIIAKKLLGISKGQVYTRYKVKK